LGQGLTVYGDIPGRNHLSGRFLGRDKHQAAEQPRAGTQNKFTERHAKLKPRSMM